MVHLSLVWSERLAGTSWRAYTDHDWWNLGDAVISSEPGAPRPSYETYTYGNLIGIRQSLAEAKALVEEVYGPLPWHSEKLPLVKIDHPYHGPTTEFSDPRFVYIVDLLPRLGEVAATVRIRGA